MSHWFIASRKQMAEDRAIKALILDQIDEMVIIHDLEGNILYVNQAFCEYCKMVESEVIKTSAADLVSSNDPDGFYQRIKEIYLNKKVKFNWEHINPVTGEWKWAEVNARLITINQGKAILSVVRDITDKVLYEKELFFLTHRYQMLLENTTDWITEANEELCFTYSNAQSLPLLGYAPEELVGRKATETMLPGSVEKGLVVAELVKKQVDLKNKMPVCLEHFSIHKNGDIVRLETIVSSYRLPNGKIIFTGISRDADAFRSNVLDVPGLQSEKNGPSGTMPQPADANKEEPVFFFDHLL